MTQCSWCAPDMGEVSFAKEDHEWIYFGELVELGVGVGVGDAPSDT